MFLLDTNVVSELRKLRPDEAVRAWLVGVPENQLFLSAFTIGEIQLGIEKKREEGDLAMVGALDNWLGRVVDSYKVIPVSEEIFMKWAQLYHGRPNKFFGDAIIAATALIHGMTVATRNVRDFAQFPVDTYNPFEYRE
ncbi:MAG: type II toxin-antitoxin system VapC family toxin [Deltaproteobacteria bacterium]|nr:type II toxin-antitoxin system VapC family toxin [Deltaproteobacteria bacterium]MDD9853906.1 type II toxin-antitoxin system VapC family toxin [Deltaproteobacteria bacterium]